MHLDVYVLIVVLYTYIHTQVYTYKNVQLKIGGTLSIMVIIVGNRISNVSSNPG